MTEQSVLHAVKAVRVCQLYAWAHEHMTVFEAQAPNFGFERCSVDRTVFAMATGRLIRNPAPEVYYAFRVADADAAKGGRTA